MPASKCKLADYWKTIELTPSYTSSMPPKRAATQAQASTSASAQQQQQQQPATKRRRLVTKSPGDAYLLLQAAQQRSGSGAASASSSLSQTLLSNALDEPFSSRAYVAALRRSLKSSAVGRGAILSSTASTTTTTTGENGGSGKSESKERRTRTAACFEEWQDELDAGFPVLIYGAGSKRHTLEDFARFRALRTPTSSHGADRKKSTRPVCILDGFDPALSTQAISDVICAALSRHFATPNTAVDSTGGIATEEASAAGGGIFARALSLLDKLGSSSTETTTTTLTLVIHAFDGPLFRSSKTLALLRDTLLRHPRVRLIGSLDHPRGSFALSSFFLAPSTSSFTSTTDSSSRSSGALLLRPVFHSHAADIGGPPLPFFREVAASALFSRLVPPIILLDSALGARAAAIDGSHGAASSSSMGAVLDPARLTSSATYVLASVSERSRKVFRQLLDLQLGLFHSLFDPAAADELSSVVRKLNATATNGAQTPAFAVTLERLKSCASDKLLAQASQVDGHLAEFCDHGVVRRSAEPPPSRRRAAPDEEEADDDGDDEQGDEDQGASEWVWIPLRRDDLLSLRESLPEL